MIRRIFKILISLIFSIVCLCSFACDDGREFVLVNDYSKYLSSLVEYAFTDGSLSGGVDDDVLPDAGDEIPIMVKSPSIDDLNLLNEYMFDDATSFFGNHSFVRWNGIVYLFDVTGKMEEIPQKDDSASSDIVLVDTLFDKILVKKEEKYGVLDLSGKTIVDIKYDSIEIYEDLIICFLGDRFDIYKDNQLYKENICANSIGVIGNGIINIDGEFINIIDWTTPKIGEYYIADAPADGMVKVRSGGGEFGYCAYPSGNLIISPQYFIGNSFSEGVTVVQNKKNSYELDYPKIIDKENNELFNSENFSALGIAPENVRIYSSNEKFLLYSTRKNNVYYYGVIDLRDKNAVERFPIDFIPKDMRVQNGFLIEEGSSTLYDVDAKSFVQHEYQEITAFDKYFIAKGPSGYDLLDNTLSVLITDCELIDFYANVIRIKIANKFAYYTI